MTTLINLSTVTMMHSPDAGSPCSPCVTWPQILNQLTFKAGRDGHLDAVKRATSIEAVVRRVRDVAGIR